ncbi:MAG: DegT/DnrJ/EryC1/StrS family aminotransferase [Geminocystis sp.]|nr:DegT/DnrJ/EryC1/StrS family aminotransferase [Geminocystis sp.]MCS7147146.1 DegT/DnrJ/EryC1/StrS family aminotransferase [Geminocystis sp.]
MKFTSMRGKSLMFTSGKSNGVFHFFKGRVALYAILKAMGIGEGDEVILPGFTCIVVPNAIVYLGAKPVYVDINPDTYNIDVSKIEGKITEKTKAIIAQHTFGIPAEMDKILGLAKKYNLYVVEDSCHAMGSRYKAQEAGTFGDAAFFSSQWSKPVTTGLGGWAVVNNAAIKEKLGKIYPEFTNPSPMEVFLLRTQYLLYEKILTPSLFWFAQSLYRKLYESGIIKGSSSPEELSCKMPPDYKRKMSRWQRGLLNKKLANIQELIEHRRQIAKIYEEELEKAGIKTVELPDCYDTVFLRYPLVVKNNKKIIRLAKEKGIEIGDWFVSPVHPLMNPLEWKNSGYNPGECPIAEDICRHIINLPTHAKITQNGARKIVQLIKETE